jgi:hypothetical protein
MQEIETAQQKLQLLETKNASLIEWCNKAVVTNTDEQHNVEDLLTEIKQYEKQLIESENSIINPLKEVIDKIRAMTKDKKLKIAQIKAHLIKLLDGWRKQQLSVTETVVMQRAETYWEQRKEAEKTGEILPALPDLNVNPLPKTSHHNMGTTNYRPKIIVKVLKPALVPRPFCMPSESLLRKHADLYLSQDKPLPTVEGVEYEIEYSPRSYGVK